MTTDQQEQLRAALVEALKENLADILKRNFSIQLHAKTENGKLIIQANGLVGNELVTSGRAEISINQLVADALAKAPATSGLT